MSLEKIDDNASFSNPKTLKAEEIKIYRNYRNLAEIQLKNGSFPFLPNEKGYLNTYPSVNIGRDTVIIGIADAILKAKKALRNYKTDEWITPYTAKELGYDPAGLEVTSVVIGGKEDKSVIDFVNIEQFGEKSGGLKLAAGMQVLKHKTEQFEKYIEWRKSQGLPCENFKAPDHGADFHGPRKNVVPVLLKDADPATYLSTYYDAVLQNLPVQASKEVADKFVANLKEVISKKFVNAKGVEQPDVYSVKNVFEDASHNEHKKEKERREAHKQKNTNPEISSSKKYSGPSMS